MECSGDDVAQAEQVEELARETTAKSRPTASQATMPQTYRDERLALRENGLRGS